MNLRRFSPIPGHEDNQKNYEDIKKPLKQILKWMKKAGVQHVPDIVVVFEQAKLLARNMEKDVTDFYKACEDPNTACHMWHYKGEDGVLHVRSGTIIQKDIWTKPRFYSTSPDFLWLYTHCLLKTENEVVVEGMCKVIGRHADSTRGLSIVRYAMEARLL
jgi:hypothetical protein